MRGGRAPIRAFAGGFGFPETRFSGARMRWIWAGLDRGCRWWIVGWRQFGGWIGGNLVAKVGFFFSSHRLEICSGASGDGDASPFLFHVDCRI